MLSCRSILRRWWPICVVLLASAPCLANDLAPEALISAKCAVAVQFDGFDPHRAAFDRTALAELLRGDLGPLAADFRRRVLGALGPDIVAQRMLAGGRPEELTALQAEAEQLPAVFEALRQRGMLIGVDLPDSILPGVHTTFVFPDGGSDDVRPALESAIRLVARLAEIKLGEREHAGRKLLEGKFFGLGRLACWQEGRHFVVTIGTLSPDATIALAEGKYDSLADDARWAKLRSFDEYETYLRGYVDAQHLQNVLTRWVAPARPILAQFGVDGLSRVSVQLGFEGPYQRLTIAGTTAGERRGLINLLAGGGSLDLKRLPALPTDASTVWTLRMEPAEAYRFGIGTIEKIISVVDPKENDAFRRDLAQFESALGGEAMKQALAALGPTIVLCNEPGGVIPLFGGALSIEVKNAEALEQAREQVVAALAQAAREEFELVRSDYRGTTVYVFQSKQQFVPVFPSFAVHNGWLHVAMSPQAVQGAIYRASDKGQDLELVRELQERLARRLAPAADGASPRKLVAFSQTDPRPSVKVLLGIVPFFSRVLGINGEGGLFQGFDTALVPHAQPITEPLSPNFSMLTSDESEIRFEVYSTLPMPIDFASFGTLIAFAGF
jgi:hypothetical protein